MKSFTVAFSVIFCFSCTNEKLRKANEQHSKDTLIQEVEDSMSLPMEDTLKTYRGLFRIKNNMLQFKNCDNIKLNYLVMDSTGKMDELYKKMLLKSPALPYENVYVEVKGILEPLPGNAKKKGFDSTLIVKETLTFEQKNYKNTCIPYDFWALGTRPDWSLQISEKESIIALKDFSNNRVYVFSYYAPKIVNDGYTYHSNNFANQTSIKATFKQQQCSEDTAGNKYSYSVSVLMNGKKYNGCAINGLKN
ncbi:MAG: hypothetical protein H0V65_04565 [Chitinophagales bacterium]|nr:hypothetical protein [Chitinophagales bacterium]